MNKMLEIQNRYAEVLAKCYELYQKGRKCLFEGMPEKSYNCSNCKHSNRNRFCKANSMLKKLIRLLAEGMKAESYLVGDEAAAKPRAQGTPITDEHILNFKALNIAVALSSPKAKETIWLVPERSGNSGLEFTPEDIRILEAAVTAFNGEILKITNPKQEVKDE